MAVSGVLPFQYVPSGGETGTRASMFGIHREQPSPWI